MSDSAMREEGGAGLAPVVPLFTSAATGAAATQAEMPDAAANTLLRRLRARSLSVREAEAILQEEGASPEEITAVIARYGELGYLDDAALAGHLVDTFSTRRGQGRRAIAQKLIQRGIPRSLAEAALLDLPDDEAERALECARTRVRSVRGVSPDAALRRLVGQLSRRGYPSAVALDAARAALAEQP